MRQWHFAALIDLLVSELNAPVIVPYLLRASSLIVGNNSGPKHLAAALGVPTVGVHSAVVFAVEWAPLGSNPVGLRRDMACSPVTCLLLLTARDAWRASRPAAARAACRRLLQVA
jgi:ADP-heptose:LPS heptosyltransferase